MIVVVRTESAELMEPDVFTALSVRSDLSAADLAEAVARHRLGRVDTDGAHVWLEPEVLRTAEEQQVAGLAGMLAFAATRGWVDEDGRVRAHIEVHPS